jgi:hypothetical protein
MRIFGESTSRPLTRQGSSLEIHPPRRHRKLVLRRVGFSPTWLGMTGIEPGHPTSVDCIESISSPLSRHYRDWLPMTWHRLSPHVAVSVPPAILSRPIVKPWSYATSRRKPIPRGAGKPTRFPQGFSSAIGAGELTGQQVCCSNERCQRVSSWGLPLPAEEKA